MIDFSPGATELLVWGLAAHLICDWLLQNEWMALWKDSLRHPAGYVHAGIHTAGLLLVFPPVVAVALGVSHLLIDTRRPVVWLSRVIRQTQPEGRTVRTGERGLRMEDEIKDPRVTTLYDLGTEVRIWTDQVWHVTALAVAALLVG